MYVKISCVICFNKFYYYYVFFSHCLFWSNSPGEDRWLCTLLLQRGYRVEYSAASDAYTHCPEGFGEFYNQRRRWVPSTMANIMDLLGDYKRTIKINDNISLPYIAYQVRETASVWINIFSDLKLYIVRLRYTSYKIRIRTQVLTLYGPNSFFRRFLGHNLR